MALSCLQRYWKLGNPYCETSIDRDQLASRDDLAFEQHVDRLVQRSVQQQNVVLLRGKQFAHAELRVPDADLQPSSN